MFLLSGDMPAEGYYAKIVILSGGSIREQAVLEKNGQGFNNVWHVVDPATFRP